jgi:PAS domain-containing protein
MRPHIARIKLSEEVQRRAEIARKATSDFQKSEKRFESFAARSTIGLAVSGLDRNIIYANDAWYRFAGLDPTRNNYDDWLASVYEEDLPLVKEWWVKVLTEKKGGQFQYRCKIPFRQGHMYSDYRTAICAGKCSSS